MDKNRRWFFFGLLLCIALISTSCRKSSGGEETPQSGLTPPTNLLAVAVSISDIKLTWTNGSDNADGVRIERATDGVNFTQIGTVSANTAEYMDTGLLSSTQYQYRIRAYNSAGNSAYSNVATGMTQELITSPTTPSAPINLLTTAVSSSSIKLTWSSGSVNADGFKVERSADAVNFTEIGAAGAGTAEYVDTGLLPSTQYQYRVRAYNSAGVSGYSNVASGTTKEPTQVSPTPVPGAPINLLGTAVSNSEIKLSWSGDSQNSDGFMVERARDAANFMQIGTVSANTAEYADTGLAPSTQYQYRVRAYNSAGNSAYSNVATVTTKELTTDSTTPGEFKVLVALFNYADDNSQPLSLLDIQNLVVNNSDSLNAFVKETSSNKAALNVDFRDWSPLAKNRSAYTDNTGLLLNDAIQILDSQVDLKKYSHLFVIYAGSVTSHYCGEASIGEAGFTAPRAVAFKMRFSDIGTACLTSDNQLDKRHSQFVLEHEFGHTLGLLHPLIFDCPGDTHLPKNLLDLRTCIAYSDWTTTMSIDIGQYSAIDKALIGWIDANQIRDSISSGEYIIDQVESESQGIKTIRIPIGNDKNGETLYYWLEYRKGAGIFDSEVNDYFHSYTSAKIMDLLYLKLRPDLFFSGNLIHNNEEFAFVTSSYKVISGADTNEPFLDPYRGIKVELIEKTGAGADAKARVLITRSDLKVDPDGVVNFGRIGGNTSLNKTITITNTGPNTITIGDATVEGDGNFTINNNTCQGLALNSNASCSITLTFAAQVYGTYLATLSVATNDSLRPSIGLSLYGER